MGMLRSFIAVHVVQLPGITHLIDELGKIHGAKPVKPEHLHITLKFLGDVHESNEIPEIIQALETSAKRHNNFEIVFQGIGAFPNRKRIRVIWVGINSSELVKLGEDIIQNLPGRNNQKGKKFTPHLTAARIKKPSSGQDCKKILRKYSGQDFGKLNVTEFQLMKSTLTPQGPIHENIKKFPFSWSRNTNCESTKNL